MKYKVGDKVRVRKDLIPGTCYGAVQFTKTKREYCGETIVIEEVLSCSYMSKGWAWSDEMFEPLPESVHITRDGDTIHAVHKQNGKVVNRSKATCSPADTFDFNIGAELAFKRLIGEVKPKEPEKPRFDFDLFRTKKQAVKCLTEHDAEIFLTWLHGKGMAWESGKSLLMETHWKTGNKNITYTILCNGLVHSLHPPYGNEIMIFEKSMLEGQ